MAAGKLKDAESEEGFTAGVFSPGPALPEDCFLRKALRGWRGDTDDLLPPRGLEINAAKMLEKLRVVSGEMMRRQ